ncbi:hypothetical protein PCASD_02099 [Puccinia coronata f. sp. avenae]|uniref:Uncharacterized protein n=1 Tax=Puccinia coronata f. sp. avenae TaxID=200324 RepID=A0A2N5VPS8_9BASI|nr:hypothetical protein PCASD_02099 [Puccinia coronata f. sp. avenae]
MVQTCSTIGSYWAQREVGLGLTAPLVGKCAPPGAYLAPPGARQWLAQLTPQTGIPGRGALFAGVRALLVFSGKVRAGGAGARRAPGGGAVNPRWGKSTGRKTVHYQLLESHVENSGRTDIRHMASRCMRGAARKGGITGASLPQKEPSPTHCSSPSAKKTHCQLFHATPPFRPSLHAPSTQHA